MPCDSRKKSVGNVLSMKNLQFIRDWGFFRLTSLQFLVRNAVFDLVCLNCLVKNAFF